jgi:hypothetical protein
MTKALFLKLSNNSILRFELPPALTWTATFLFYLSLIAIVFADHAFSGFIGDGAGYVAPNTHEYSTHPLFSFLTHQDTGHPVIYAWFNGLMWRWFGIQPVIAKVSIWFYAAFSVVATQYLAQRVVENSSGPVAPR